MYSNLFKRTVTSIFLILLLIFGLYYNDITWKILVIIFLCVCLYEFYNIIKKIYKNKSTSTILIFLIALYLYFFYFLMMNFKTQFGKEVILILLMACIFSDLGGYVVGKLIGGPKLTSISPNKTVSGAFGSILFTVFGTSLFIMFFNKIDNYSILQELSLTIIIWLIVMSLYSQIGDLIISYFKRKAKIKDTGNILPGHGGVLDRVDGILFAIPFGILTYFFMLV